MNKIKKKLTLYACGIDWQHECGPGGSGDVIFYESVKVHKHYHPAWRECGIVRIEGEMQEMDWPEPQRLGERSELLGRAEELIRYALGPTRDVKTGKLEEALKLVRKARGTYTKEEIENGAGI